MITCFALPPTFATRLIESPGLIAEEGPASETLTLCATDTFTVDNAVTPAAFVTESV